MSGASTGQPTLAELGRLVGEVTDPEIPVLTIADLGVLRSVRAEHEDGGQRIVVSITPTYSGCPAMHDIEARVLDVLAANGVDGTVETVWSPAWTTDWMSDEGRRKLRDYGIAPPNPTAGPHGSLASPASSGGPDGTPVVIAGGDPSTPSTTGRAPTDPAPTDPAQATWAATDWAEAVAEVVACPRCSSTDTEVISEFGSTACKALYRCRACAEPFDYFKGH